MIIKVKNGPRRKPSKTAGEISKIGSLLMKRRYWMNAFCTINKNGVCRKSGKE
jgi:hypothetical protein